ncbi:MAG: DNA methyltransferase [Thermoplasmata archaeon]
MQYCKSINELRATCNLILDIIRSNHDLLSADFLPSEDANINIHLESLTEELTQIHDSFTFERGMYYVRRLLKSLTQRRTTKINDINLLRWKDYGDILTDSFWSFDRRTRTGSHSAWYWGNFVPQIPNQLLRRYTKQYDWVLDPFSGSGTTLIECKRLGRNGVGIELNSTIVQESKKVIDAEDNPFNVKINLLNADSSTATKEDIFADAPVRSFQFIILHPPYSNIIRFSRDSRDLSNYESTQDFLSAFEKIVENVKDYLDYGRYMGLVVGDKFSHGEWIPLGFMTMNQVLKHEFILKSIVVKNFEETRGKRNSSDLWRYRALLGGYYVFKHEYIFIFRKEKRKD